MREGRPLLVCILQDSIRRSKLDGPLLLRVQVAAQQGMAEEILSVLVRINGALTPTLREELAQTGLALHGIVGDIVSGSIRTADLYHLTALGAVRYVALSGTFQIRPPTE